MTWLPKLKKSEAWLHRFRAKARALEPPEPSTELLERILASRAAGARVVLETDDHPRNRSRSVRRLAAAATVVLVVGASAVLRWHQGPGNAARQAPPLDDLTRLMFPWPSMALAQQPDAPPSRPRYGSVPDLDGARLHAGEWRYQVRVKTDGILTSERGRRAYALAEATFGGHPVWRITTSWHPQGFVDSILVDRATLRPLRRVFQPARVRFIQEHSTDSLREWLVRRAAPQDTVRSAVALPNAPLIDWLTTKVALQALPLAPSWRGSLYVVSTAARGLAPLNLRVVGRETITVPAGTFDCWKIKADGPDYVENDLIWVSRHEHWVIKTRSRPAYDTEFEELLVSHTSQGPR